MKSYHTAKEIEDEFSKHYCNYNDVNNGHRLWVIGLQEYYADHDETMKIIREKIKSKTDNPDSLFVLPSDDTQVKIAYQRLCGGGWGCNPFHNDINEINKGAFYLFAYRKNNADKF